ncbi:hypothetical protein [Syntrophomonas wolfei]|jgi:hypothetical protein|nr:hypothetical protein [Syntrophomonas wolfei]
MAGRKNAEGAQIKQLQGLDVDKPRTCTFVKRFTKKDNVWGE